MRKYHRDKSVALWLDLGAQLSGVHLGALFGVSPALASTAHPFRPEPWGAPLQLTAGVQSPASGCRLYIPLFPDKWEFGGNPPPNLTWELQHGAKGAPDHQPLHIGGALQFQALGRTRSQHMRNT